MSKRVYFGYLKYRALPVHIFNAADKCMIPLLDRKLFHEYFNVSVILVTEYSILYVSDDIVRG